MYLALKVIQNACAEKERAYLRYNPAKALETSARSFK